MKQYRGYYIDHIIFNSKEDIDNMIKRNQLDGYRKAVQCFTRRPTMEMSIHCDKLAERLVKDYGFTYEELEEIEIEAIKTA